MNNMWQKIKRFRGWIISCIVFLVVVQILYTIPAPSKWLEARWEAGDLISFVGTIVLGIVAIWQTKEANDMSKRLMQIEENRHKLEVRPFVMLKDWRCFYEDTFRIQAFPDQLYIYVCSSKGEPRAFCILLELTNTTEAYVSV